MDAARVDPQAVLLRAAADYPPIDHSAGRIAIVGGFVRDVALGREPKELDLVVEGSAEALARSFGGELTVHDAFGTATASGEDWRVDVAMARAEHYPAPGALPEVAPASIEADLTRRDFTVNAIAVTLDGELIPAEHALEDLGAGRLRVFHERSFSDDPSRVLRLARYAERLGFAVEARTAELAAAAMFANLSGGRVGGELRLVLSEPDALAVLARVAHQLPIALDRELLESALALAPPGSDSAMLVLGTAATDPPWLETLELTAGERDIALACANAGAAPSGARPSELWLRWRRTPIEAVAVAGARGDRAAAARWIDELRLVSLEIGGDDLLAAGIAEGPEIGRRLERTLAARLDGEIEGGREAELRFALGAGG